MILGKIENKNLFQIFGNLLVIGSSCATCSRFIVTFVLMLEYQTSFDFEHDQCITRQKEKMRKNKIINFDRFILCIVVCTAIDKINIKKA